MDSYVPIAVFLGMHLLFTDPSTAPRSELGRICFGVVYALSVMALYVILGHLGAPTFYDKLMAVPLMNIGVRAIDRLAHARRPWAFDPARIGARFRGRRRNLAYITVWTAVFIVLSAVQGVGDTHRGQWVPFWQQGCAEGRVSACRVLTVKLDDQCRAGSGWACNEYGVLLGSVSRSDEAGEAFERACRLGLSAGCANRTGPSDHRPLREAPRLRDYEVVVHWGPRAHGQMSPRQAVPGGVRPGLSGGV